MASACASSTLAAVAISTPRQVCPLAPLLDIYYCILFSYGCMQMQVGYCLTVDSGCSNNGVVSS